MGGIVFTLTIFNIFEGNIIHDLFPNGLFYERKSLTSSKLPKKEKLYYDYMQHEKHELDHFKHAMHRVNGHGENH